MNQPQGKPGDQKAEIIAQIAEFSGLLAMMLPDDTIRS